MTSVAYVTYMDEYKTVFAPIHKVHHSYVSLYRCSYAGMVSEKEVNMIIYMVSDLNSNAKSPLFRKDVIKRFSFPTYRSIHEHVAVYYGKICNA